MAKVTVISAYHNRAHAVEVTLRSISEQTFTDFDALIWDDGSTDNTWEELQRVQKLLGDDRIRVYQHKPNIGLTAGLNDAIERASGEYIAVVGSGDYCHPERLAKQVEALEANPDSPICATRSITIDEVNGKRFNDEHFDRPIITRSDIETVCPFTHGSVMYRTSELRAIGGYEPVFVWCADWDVFFRLLDRGNGIYLDEVLYERYARVDGVSFNPNKALLQIKCKHLALLLSGRDVDRNLILSTVRNEGIEQAIAERSKPAMRDSYARAIKIMLMGRRSDSINLKSLIDKEYGYDFLQSSIYYSSMIFSYLPVDSDTLINYARSIRKK